MEPILDDSQFKAPYVKLIKFVSFRKIGTMAQFPQIALIPKIPGNKYNSTLKKPWHLSRTSFKVNVMLKTLDYFLCDPTYDFGYLGPVSPNCSNVQISVKEV